MNSCDKTHTRTHTHTHTHTHTQTVYNQLIGIFQDLSNMEFDYTVHSGAQPQ